MIDLCVNKSNVILEHDVDLVLQQIDILFDTQVDEVFGEADYGSYFDQFLWDLSISNTYIEQYTDNLIRGSVNLLGYNVRSEVKIYQGTENDIILITIHLTRDAEDYEKTYKLS